MYTLFNFMHQNALKFAFSGYIYTKYITSNKRPSFKKKCHHPRTSIREHKSKTQPFCATEIYQEIVCVLLSIPIRVSVYFILIPYGRKPTNPCCKESRLIHYYIFHLNSCTLALHKANSSHDTKMHRKE